MKITGYRRDIQDMFPPFLYAGQVRRTWWIFHFWFYIDCITLEEYFWLPSSGHPDKNIWKLSISGAQDVIDRHKAKQILTNGQK